MHATGPIHLLLVGAPGSEFSLAAAMARDAGAHVALADCAKTALLMLRDDGGDIVMIDIAEDVGSFIAQLRSERIAVPVLACGIDAPADRAVAAIRAGARDYVPLPPQADLIAAAILSVAQHGTRMVGDDPALGRALALGLAMAHSNAPLLIVGEAGCGKEIFARAMHDASGRRGRFVAIDCASTSTDILESELFGHEVGAFPGAIARRRGRLEEAYDGTVFLRDVEALSPAIQARMLTALQGQHVHHPIVEPSGLRARIMASTAADLDMRVAKGLFQGNLLARLGLVRIAVPPLRARPGDIVPMAQYFADRFALANDVPARPFGKEAIGLLQKHDWPGNVRELEDTVHRAVLLNRDPSIAASAIVTIDGASLGAAPATVIDRNGFVGCTVEDMERDLILHTLHHCRGNRTSASTILGISVRTMRNKLKTFIEAGIPVSPAL
ncbi:sigma-54-dependent transcriptional regulator [Sphingomonas echinoides]|uniref:sigma-54-dependent transcriptional regulator n=1 Tax=Sphingomonas echinoides TaxID=59803 RepID=UPI0024133A8A|nr:sigma-54 dependent transcriptional regulator [Sphingomonas echinoides]